MRKLAIALLCAGSLAGCTAAQIQSATTTIEGDIQAGVAAACGIVPTLATITEVASVLFPGSAGLIGIVASGEAAIEADICKAVPPAASAKFRAIPRAAYGVAPAVIGVTPHGVGVTGWRAR